MQRRPWVLAVALMLVAMVFSFIVGIRYLNRSNRLRYEILTLLEDLPGEVDIEKASIQSSTLLINNLSYQSESKDLDVVIKRISVRFSVSNWVKYGGNKRHILQSIAVIEPKVKYYSSGRDKKKLKLKIDPLIFSEIGSLERILIRNAEFDYYDADGNEWIAIKSIDGWMLKEGKSISYELSASLYENVTNKVTMKGRIATERGTLDGQLNISEYELGEIELPESAPIDIEDGILDASIVYELSDTLLYEANWGIKDAIITIKNGPVLTKVNQTGWLEDGVLTTDGNALFEGDYATVSAKYNGNGENKLRAKAHIREGRIGKHLMTFADMSYKAAPRGLIDAKGDFVWNPANGYWQFYTKALADTIGTPIGRFDDVDLDLSWDHKDNALSFDKLTTKWQGLDVKADAKYRPGKKERFPVNVDVDGVPEPFRLPRWTKPLKKKNVKAHITINYSKSEKWRIEGTGIAKRNDNSDPAMLYGRYDDNGYDLELRKRQGKGYKVSLRMYDMDGDGVKFSVEQPQELGKWWDKKYNTNPFIESLMTKVSLRVKNGKIYSGAYLEEQKSGISARIDGIIYDHKNKQDIRVGYKIERDGIFVGNGEVDAIIEGKVVNVSELSFMDYFHLEGKYDYEKKNLKDIEADIIDLDFGEIVSVVSAIPRNDVAGMMNGQIRINGPVNNPNVAAHLEVYEGKYKNLEKYWGIITIDTGVEGKVYVQQGSVGRAETTLLDINGDYSIPENNLNIFIDSPGSDASVLSNALFGEEKYLSGTLLFNGDIKGDLLNPNWNVRLSMNEAKVVGVEFDSIDMSIHGEKSEKYVHIIEMKNYSMVKKGEYAVNAFGTVPIKNGKGNINTILDGNILGMLPQTIEYISSARGNGRIVWDIVIEDGKAVSATGEMRIGDGNVVMNDIVPAINDINVDIEVDNGGDVDIRSAVAKIGGKNKIILENERGDEGIRESRSVKTNILGLNFGVLKLRSTGNKGIPIRVPEITMEKEFANVAFKGVNGEEWFRIAGPIDSLYINGAIEVGKANIIYPQMEVKKTNGRNKVGIKKSTVVNIFKNATYNSEIIVDRDVHYQVVFKSLENTPLLETFSELIGQLNVDVIVEPTEPNRPLRVTGRIKDETFRMDGELISTRGQIDLFDMSFQMDRAEVMFDKTSVLPVVSGRAISTIYDPQTEISNRIFLKMYVLDPATGEKKPRGRWGDITFVFEDDYGTSQEQLLSTMGYDVRQGEKLQKRATDMAMGGIDRAVTRRWLRPIERDVERLLGLDVVKIDPSIAKNVFSNPVDTVTSVGAQTQEQRGYYEYLRASKFTVGKYLTPDLFLSYTGQLGEDPKYASSEDIYTGRMGYLQKWSLEYRLTDISPNFVLQAEWLYDSAIDAVKEDPNIRSYRLKYTFVYDLSSVNWARIWRGVKP